jgi:hypothetical protein
VSLFLFLLRRFFNLSLQQIRSKKAQVSAQVDVATGISTYLMEAFADRSAFAAAATLDNVLEVGAEEDGAEELSAPEETAGAGTSALCGLALLIVR